MWWIKSFDVNSRQGHHRPMPDPTTAMPIERRTISFPGGEAEWFMVPWDSEIMNFAVAQLSNLILHDKASQTAATVLRDTFLREGLRLVSARLPLSDLQASMFLEMVGFRFIEVTCQPRFPDLPSWSGRGETTGLEVIRVTDKENLLPMVEEIAGRAFRNERFHVDPRLDPRLSDERYRYWVRSTIVGHPTQSLYALREKEATIGFFITEDRPLHDVYWHLTAIAPEFQGRGYGLRAWKKMMEFHRQSGRTTITTTIVARNLAVVNLYAKLGFRFTKPEMGFHWWAGDVA